MISKSTLLSAITVRIEKVEVPLEGGHVFVKGMTAQERDNYEVIALEKKEPTFSRAMLLLFTVCDESGSLIFSIEDLETIKKLDASIVQPLYNKAIDLSTFSEEDIKAFEKN